MGSFNVSDFVTGDSIERGDKVVAFLVRHAVGYPFDKNMSQPSLRPTDRWKLESLPIHGKYDDYGGIEPKTENCVSVKLALQMTGCANWEQLVETAIEGEGASIKILSFTPGDQDTVCHRYSLAIMHETTAKALLALAAPRPAMRAEIDQALAVYDLRSKFEEEPEALLAVAAMEAPHIQALRNAIFSIDSLCALGGNRIYVDPDRKVHDAPPVLYAGDDVFGEDFRFMRKEITGPAPKDAHGVRQKAHDRPELAALLADVWHVQRYNEALDTLGREFAPSMRLGQWDNAIELLDFNRRIVQHRFERLVTRRLELGQAEKELPAVRSLAQRFGDTAAALHQKIDRAFKTKIARRA